MLRLPTPIQSVAILCGALICLASAHAMVPALKPLPPPAAMPQEPPDWSLVLLPEPDWTKEEAAQALIVLSRIQPSMIVVPKRFDWLAALQKQLPDCRIVVLDEPPKQPPAEKSTYSTYSTYSTCHDASSPHPIPHKGTVPASLLRMRTVPSGQRRIGPRANPEESRTILMARTRRAFAKMSGDVVFLFEHPYSWLTQFQWDLHQKAPDCETRITRPVAANWPSLSGFLPPHAGTTTRTPLLHLITGNAKSVSWDVLPADGSPALWHRKSLGMARKSGKHPSPEVLFAPPSFDTPPKWMNAYVTGNPSLFPFSDLTPRRTPVKRLPWRKLPGTDNPSGFPKLYLPRAKSIGMHDIDPARLPQDAVRSPSFRFALLPNRYDKRGVWQLDGDDGLEVRLADLQAKISGRLYYSGMYGAWPVGATWFTDRFLLVAGAGPNSYTVLDRPPEAGDARDLMEGTGVLRVRLYDLWAGLAFSATMLPPAPGTSANFTEKIAFPDGETYEKRLFWDAVWKAVETGLTTRNTPPPIPPEKAAELLGFKTPPAAKWSFLGPWPPPETWEPVDRPITIPAPPRCGDPLIQALRLRHYSRNPHPGGDHTIWLDIQDFGQNSAYYESQPPFARAELMKTGGGLLPRLTAVHRCKDELKRILLLGGHAPLPGPEGGQMQWILMLDSLTHEGWKLNWTAGTDG